MRKHFLSNWRKRDFFLDTAVRRVGMDSKLSVLRIPILGSPDLEIYSQHCFPNISPKLLIVLLGGKHPCLSRRVSIVSGIRDPRQSRNEIINYRIWTRRDLWSFVSMGFLMIIRSVTHESNNLEITYRPYSFDRYATRRRGPSNFYLALRVSRASTFFLS